MTCNYTTESAIFLFHFWSNNFLQLSPAKATAAMFLINKWKL